MVVVAGADRGSRCSIIIVILQLNVGSFSQKPVFYPSFDPQKWVRFGKRTHRIFSNISSTSPSRDVVCTQKISAKRCVRFVKTYTGPLGFVFRSINSRGTVLAA